MADTTQPSSWTERLRGQQKARARTTCEFNDLAEQHLKHDLTPEDRDLLYRAGRKISTHTTVGALVGLGLGLWMTLRLRNNAMRFFQAAKNVDKPTAIKYADGREVPLPDLTPMLQPSPATTALTGFLFCTAGTFLGGELGLLTGSASARSTVRSNPEARQRIENAFRGFRADALRKQADMIERMGAQRRMI